MDITYKWFLNGDILSLVIMPNVYGGNTGDDYDIYNISISKCRLMTDEEVYAASGVENLEVRIAHAIASAAGEFWSGSAVAMSDWERNYTMYEFYFGSDGMQQWTTRLFAAEISVQNVLDVRPYLGRNGDLYINGCAFTTVGSGQHWLDIRVDDYPTDKVYTPRQYCDYYAQTDGQRSWNSDYGKLSVADQVSYTPAETVVPNVSDLVDTTLRSTFHIPVIELPGPKVEAINQEILRDYREPFETDVCAVDYEWTVQGDILSLVIMGTNSDGKILAHSVYNISVSKCRLLENAEVYAAAGVESFQVKHAVTMGIMTALSMEDYDKYFAGQSDAMYTARRLAAYQTDAMWNAFEPYFDADGEFCVFAPNSMDPHNYVGSIEWYTVRISDYPTDRLYEPVDYFFTFYHG